MTHEQLCRRARAWLRGTRRCNPVYSNNASCREIPDAIGWSSAYSWHGSTIVECKTSVGDFYADKKKFIAYEHPVHKYTLPIERMAKKTADENGYKIIELNRMGDFRFFMCEPGILTVELIEKHVPDHGLLWVKGRRVEIVRPAPRRESVHKDSEIRYLRFAIINRKKSVDEVGELVEKCAQLRCSLCRLDMEHAFNEDFSARLINGEWFHYGNSVIPSPCESGDIRKLCSTFNLGV